MKPYDFVFIYETKNREFENICLLKCELERRGYTVALVETWRRMHYYRPRVRARIVVTFALYGDGQALFVYQHARGYKQIINLQWEQVFTAADEESGNALYHVTGAAKYAKHIAWGPYNRDWLTVRCEVPADNVLMAGHLTLDFFKPALQGYYLTKDALCERYDLDPNKRLAVFISSFSYVGLPDALVASDTYQQAGTAPEDFQSLSAISQRALIDWLQAVLPQHPDWQFVYRPHPAEVGSGELDVLAERIGNFQMIRGDSVKQWIVAADKLYTWYSTSVAEVFFAGKSCEILRPIPIPEKQDVLLYKDCRAITTQAAFADSFAHDGGAFPIREELIRSFYRFDPDTYTYMTICDLCESELQSGARNESILPDRRTRRKEAVKELLRPGVFFLRRMLGKLSAPTARMGRFGRKLSAKMEYEAFVEKMIRNNYANAEETARVQEKIRRTMRHNGITI